MTYAENRPTRATRGRAMGTLAAAAVLSISLCAVAAGAGTPLLRRQVRLVPWDMASPGARSAAAAVQDLASRSNPGLSIYIGNEGALDPYSYIRRNWCIDSPRRVPELVVIRDTWLPELARYLQPIDGRIAEQMLKDYPRSVRDRLTFADRTYGIPWRVNANCLLYNRAHFEKVGALPPRTWDELVIAARRCHNPPEMYGFGLPGVSDDGGAELALQLLWAEGADLPPVQEPEALDKAAVSAALGRVLALHAVSEPEVLSWNRRELQEFFAAGRLAMLISDKAYQDRLAATPPEFGFATCALPRGVQGTGLLSVELLCVFRASSEAEAAMGVLRSLASAEACERLLMGGGVPFHAATMEKLRLDPRHAPYVQTLAESRGLPPQRWTPVADMLAETLAWLLTGRKSVEEATDFLAERMAQGEAPSLRPGG